MVANAEKQGRRRDFPTYRSQNPRSKKSSKTKSKASKEAVSPSQTVLGAIATGASSMMPDLEQVKGWGQPVVMGAWGMLGYNSPNNTVDAKTGKTKPAGKPPKAPKRKSKADKSKSIRRTGSKKQLKAKSPKKQLKRRKSPKKSKAPAKLSKKPPTSKGKSVSKRPPRPKTEVSKESGRKGTKSVQSDSAVPKLRRTLTQLCKESAHNGVSQKDVKLGRKIGQGAFGSVFEAKNQKDGSKIAVKQIWLGGRDPRLLTNTKREIDLLAKLDHKNIVKYLGSHRGKENFSMYLELVTGGSLEDKMYPAKGRRKKILSRMLKRTASRSSLD